LTSCFHPYIVSILSSSWLMFFHNHNPFSLVAANFSPIPYLDLVPFFGDEARSYPAPLWNPRTIDQTLPCVSRMAPSWFTPFFPQAYRLSSSTPLTRTQHPPPSTCADLRYLRSLRRVLSLIPPKVFPNVLTTLSDVPLPQPNLLLGLGCSFVVIIVCSLLPNRSSAFLPSPLRN